MNYNVPGATDPEGYSPLIIKHSSIDPAYVTYVHPMFTFNPDFTVLATTLNIKVSLSDTPNIVE